MGGFGAAGSRSGPPEAVLNRYKNRYVTVTGQVRRMPVAVVLLVDQMFMQDALVAYANSPLRFQITQYHWKRFRGSISSFAQGDGGAVAPPPGLEGGTGGEYGPGGEGLPGGEGGTPDAGSGGEPSFLLGSGGGEAGFGGEPGPGGLPGGESFGPFGSGGFGGGYGFGYGTGVADGQVTSGLVELSIYGIVTLYEKYEDQPAAPTTDLTSTPNPENPAPEQPAPGQPMTPAPAPAPAPMPSDPKGTGTAPMTPKN
jgi:hypothetical protein